MIYLILLEPVTAGNVGAVARVMKNFSFDKLVLINPHCDHLCDESRNRAKHAQEVLDNAEVCEFFIVDDYDYLVATTAKVGTDYNISRSPMLPAELARKLQAIDPEKKIGIVIGREGPGMFNEEIDKCDFVVTIPSTPGYSTLNISHAVAVLLYELYQKISSEHVASHITPIGKSEKDQVLLMFDDVFDGWPWETVEKRETQDKMWKKIIGKSMLTKREAFVVMGFLRKILDERAGKFVGRKTVAKKAVSVDKGNRSRVLVHNGSVKKGRSRAGTKRKISAAKTRGASVKSVNRVKSKLGVNKITKHKLKVVKKKTAPKKKPVVRNFAANKSFLSTKKK